MNDIEIRLVVGCDREKVEKVLKFLKVLSQEGYFPKIKVIQIGETCEGRGC